MPKIIIAPEIFTKFPDFKRGIIYVKNLDNSQVSEKITLLLDEARQKVSGSASWSEHEYVKAWDETHQKFNSNPNKFPPSIKSLLKRAPKGPLPYINSAVALFNYISLKYLIPCGGDDLDTIKGNLKLGLATGYETFVSLGSQEEERPLSGEVIYVDDATAKIMCRRWNWRNGDFSKITGLTKRLVINLDGIGPVTVQKIVEARDELAGLLATQCRAELVCDLLNKDKNELELE